MVERKIESKFLSQKQVISFQHIRFTDLLQKESDRIVNFRRNVMKVNLIVTSKLSKLNIESLRIPRRSYYIMFRNESMIQYCVLQRANTLDID